jgi:hypothetical protein
MRPLAYTATVSQLAIFDEERVTHSPVPPPVISAILPERFPSEDALRVSKDMSILDFFKKKTDLFPVNSQTCGFFYMLEAKPTTPGLSA